MSGRTVAASRDRRLLAVAAVALVLLAVAGGVGLRAWQTHRAPESAVAPGLPDRPQPLVDGRPVRFGPDAARTTVTLYEDFHCPHCAEFEDAYGATLAAAQQAGTAKVELYPMSFVDTGSAAAANALGCAAEAGFGQAYARGLFTNHTLVWSDSQLVALAGAVGATPGASFSTCITSRARAGWAGSIDAVADAAGVSSTPAVFVNGRPIPLDGLTPGRLQNLIDSGAGR